MKVADVMTRAVEFIDPGVTVQEAAERMGELDVGGLPAGSPEQVEGIITDRDILYRVVAAGLDPRQARVREVLSRPAIACTEDDTIAAAMDTMAENHIRRMPVRDASGRVSGWITLADLARKLLVDGDALQDMLRAATEPEE